MDPLLVIRVHGLDLEVNAKMVELAMDIYVKSFLQAKLLIQTTFNPDKILLGQKGLD